MRNLLTLPLKQSPLYATITNNLTKEVYHDRLRKAVPRSPFPVPRSPFPVPRSPFPVQNKTQSLRRNFALFIVFSLFFALASCDSDPDPEPDPPQPSCTITNHAIDDDLSCGHTAKVYGTINEIPVYRTKAVTEAQATAAYGNALAAYNQTFSGKENISTAKVSAIHIIAGDITPSCVSDGKAKFILSLPSDLTVAQMRTMFAGFGGSVLAIQLKQFGNPEQPVRMAFGKTRAVKKV